MAYNTNLYLMIFLPMVVVLYQLTPEKHRWKTLTLASVIYFLLLSKWLIAWSFVTTAITWGGGLMVQRMLDEAGQAYVDLRHITRKQREAM